MPLESNDERQPDGNLHPISYRQKRWNKSDGGHCAFKNKCEGQFFSRSKTNGFQTWFVSKNNWTRKNVEPLKTRSMWVSALEFPIDAPTYICAPVLNTLLFFTAHRPTTITFHRFRSKWPADRSISQPHWIFLISAGGKFSLCYKFSSRDFCGYPHVHWF